jgi:hypothetical protein
MSTTTTPTTERPSGRHPVNVGHLVMGIAFLGLVGVWALIQGDVVEDADVRWLLPVPWVLAGLAGLLATAMSSGRRWSTRQVGWVPPADTPAPDAGEGTTVLETDEPDETVGADEPDGTDGADDNDTDHPHEETR